MTVEEITPAGQAIKDFVESSLDLGATLERATLRKLVRSPCGKMSTGDILAAITEITDLGVMTTELGFVPFNDVALNDWTIYLLWA